MKYIFNFENREKPVQFNREKLILAAMQEAEQLYYMLDTQYEGIYQAEAVERRRLYGSNAFAKVLAQSSYKFLPGRREWIDRAFQQLGQQQTSVFRRGLHFYSEVDYEDLVPGDVLFIARGDIIPSDVRIVFAKDLEVDQSIYTGHAHRVKKTSAYRATGTKVEELTEIPNLCFVGSTVVSGLARGVVVNTGRATYLYHLLLM